tara:strand:- start:2860 stop:3513 length:654 start_codon:yes stop_codon:yes gene_type:complete
MAKKEYNYGTNNGLPLQNGSPFSRFGGYGITALGPKIEKNIQELVSYEWYNYLNALSGLTGQPHAPQYHQELAEILSELGLVMNTPGFPNPDPEFIEQLEAIIDNENEISETPTNMVRKDYFKHPPSKAVIKIQATARKATAKRKLRRIKDRIEVAKVMMQGQEAKKHAVAGEPYLSKYVSSYLTGDPRRGGTKKKRRKQSKKKRRKKRTKRKRLVL